MLNDLHFDLLHMIVEHTLSLSSQLSSYEQVLYNSLYWIAVGQLLTAGLDKKIMSWDTRMGMSLAYQRNLGGEVDSMSLSGFELIVAIGASVNMYDLRNLDSLVLSNESLMDAQIKCVSSIPYARGMVICRFFYYAYCKHCCYIGCGHPHFKVVTI